VAVLRSAGAPDVPADTLARLVEIDPALTAMVLRLANAPLFGFNGRVPSARQATLLLGTRTVGALAVGGTAALVFGRDGAQAHRHTTAAAGPADDSCGAVAGGGDGGGDGGEWAHAVATACATSVVARVLGVHPDEAFTAGMLHNAAWLLPAAHDDSVGCAPDASADLLRSWSLPPALVNAVRTYATPPDATAGPLARSLAVGHAIALAFTGAAPADPAALADAREAGIGAGIGAARVDEVLAAVRREIESVAAFLDEQSR
jgi:HD-like signal output (HDOD) protein